MSLEYSVRDGKGFCEIRKVFGPISCPEGGSRNNDITISRDNLVIFRNKYQEKYH